jgi:hypothetical protein
MYFTYIFINISNNSARNFNCIEYISGQSEADIKIGAVPESNIKYSLPWVIYIIKTEEWSYVNVDD